MSKVFYKMFYAAVLALFVINCFSGELMTGVMSTPKLLVILVVTAFVASISMMSGTLKIIVMTSVAATAVGSWIIGSSSIKIWMQSYIQTCWSFGIVAEEIPASYEYAQIVLISIAAGLLAIVFEKLMVSKYVCSAALISYLIYMLIKEREISHVGVVAAIAFIMTVVVELIQKNWKKRCQSEIQEYIARLVPFIVAYMVLMMLMPQSNKPYDWKYAKGMYERLSDRINRLYFNFGKGNTENFVSSKAGFSDANQFFGEISANGNIIMRLEKNSMLVTNLYLTGCCYDSFVGGGWEQIRKETPKDRVLDTMGTLYEVQMYDKEHPGDYINRARVNVEYGNYHSSHTFMPLKAYECSDTEGTSGFFISENLLDGMQRGYKDSYSFAFYQMNIDSPGFVEMLETKKDDDEARWKSLLRGYSLYSFSMDNKQAYDKQLIQDYSQDIQLSTELSQWVDENTQEAESGLQRLRMIERALSQFEYTTNPGEMPEEVDSAERFLDYFVLNSQKGYCTYFATAFTLLARAEGYAARYVEGYCVPTTKGVTEITSNMAHAWPEVYIEDFGWVPFEPTPGYGMVRYTSWNSPYSKDDDDSSREWYLEQQRIKAEQQAARENEEGHETTAKKEKKHISIEGRIFIFRLLAIILASIDLMIILVSLGAKIHYSRLSYEGKYHFKVNENIRILSLLGVKRSSEETLEEFGRRVNTNMGMLGIGEVLFLRDYEYIRYGEHEIRQEWFEQVCKDNEMLRKGLFEILMKRRRESADLE